MKWQDLENSVRETASFLFDGPAVAETINGVKCDCVVKKRHDWWVLVEISKESTLEKLRTDLAKFAVLKPSLLSQNIYCESIFVCLNDPPPSLIVSGKANNVEVCSADQFQCKLLDFPTYFHVRRNRTFGSAIDPFSGEKDERKYIPVSYDGVTVDRQYEIADIVRLLAERKKVVLLGDYGTGKSRCIQEVFSFATSDLHPAPILSVDLRDNWGVVRAQELIRRHFDDLGLSGFADNVIKVLGSNRITWLIDGFDEIGSQTWSDDPSVLRDIRRRSLSAVHDLVKKSAGGMLITGREHYFNSDEEMYQCLGLSPSSVVLIRCRDEFSDDEISEYFRTFSSSFRLPKWLPKRPLVCQVLADLAPPTRDRVLSNEAGEMLFWQTLLDAISERESKIQPLLDAQVVKRVLVKLARFTRSKMANVGPLSIEEINQAFREVTGVTPADESAAILQRLPVLGRITSETTDRQFVDMYFLDGLRGEDVNQSIYLEEGDVAGEQWANPLRDFGLRVIRSEIESSPSESSFIQVMRQCARRNNRLLAGEIAVALLDAKNGDFDFGGLYIHETHITRMDLSSADVRGLVVDQSIIERLDISSASVRDVQFRGCVIGEIEGISDAKGVPDWIQNCSIESFRTLSTVARIKNAPLSRHQRIFIAIVKKTFFQPGAGRKEEALQRGMGQSVERKAFRKVLNLLVDADHLHKIKGSEGFVYIPNRKHTRRMEAIITQLSLSDDPLWRSLPPD